MSQLSKKQYMLRLTDDHMATFVTFDGERIYIASDFPNTCYYERRGGHWDLIERDGGVTFNMKDIAIAMDEAYQEYKRDLARLILEEDGVEHEATLIV